MKHVNDDPTAAFSFPNNDAKPSVNENVIVYLARTLKSQTQNVTILAIGPGTNIALLLRTFPDVAKHIEEIVFLGGAIGIGIFLLKN